MQLLGHRPVGVTALAVTPDAQLIAAGHRDGQLRLIGVPQAAVLHTHTLDSAVLSLACTPEGNHLAVGTDDGQVRLLDRATQALAPLRPDGGARAHALAFCPQGRRLAVARGIAVEVFDITGGEPCCRMVGHGDRVTCLGFSADGRWLVTGSLDGSVRLWNADNGQPSHRLPGAGPVVALALSPDERWLAMGMADGTVSVLQWHPGGPGRERQLEGAGQAVTGLAFSPDSRWLAVGKQAGPARNAGGIVRLWDARHGSHHRDIDLPGMALSRLAYGPDGRWLVCGAPDGRVALAARVTGVAPLTVARDESPVTCAALDGEGRWLATGHEDGAFGLWEAAAGRLARQMPVHRAPVSAVAITPDARWLASGAHDGTVAVWPPRGGPWALQAPAGVTCLALSPDARWLVLGAADGCMHSVALAHLPKAGLTKGHQFDALLATAAFAPDGRVLAMATRQGLLSLWALRPGGPAARADLPGHAGAALAFSPDGRWLASSLHGGGVCLWDRAAHREARRLEAAGMVTQLRFDPTSRHLTGADADGRAWQWQVPDGTLLSTHAAAPYRHACVGLACMPTPMTPWPPGPDTLQLRRLDPNAGGAQTIAE